MSQPPQPSASTAHPHPDPLQPACEHLRAGGLVILPTDTVYGIGCNAADAGAVERLLAAKGRGRQMPPPVLVADPADLTGIVAQVPDAASARAAFPGRVWDIEELTPGTGGVGAVGREDILLLDGGATPGPVPSTIVTLAGAHARAPRILRQGVLARGDLERVVGVALSERTAEAAHDGTEAGA